jgi:hypothetical protein
MTKALKYSCILILIAAIYSCNSDGETIEVETPELQLLAEAPFFEGSNTATATWEVSLPDLLANSGTTVKKAKVTAIEITLKPQEDQPILEKMVFEITSANTPMTRVGLFEYELKPGELVVLNVAEKQENLSSAFQDGKMTFVGDFDLLGEEYWENISFTVKIKFELEVK